jgi:predicted nucleic acid-binding protein
MSPHRGAGDYLVRKVGEVGIKDLKRDAGAIVYAVEAGETIDITRRGADGSGRRAGSRTAARGPGPDELARGADERSDRRLGARDRRRPTDLRAGPRGPRLTAPREREAWARFERTWSTAAIPDVDRTQLAIATELAGRRGLRAYDAVQLAGGLRPADVTGAQGFVCLDHELSTAAGAEGLTCLVT